VQVYWCQFSGTRKLAPETCQSERGLKERREEKGVEGWERQGMGWEGLRRRGVRKEGRKGGMSFCLPTSKELLPPMMDIII